MALYWGQVNTSSCILHPAPAFPAFEVKYLFRDLIYMLCFVGLGEELLFRGLIQTDLMKVFGGKMGLVLASLLFAVMHLTWRSLPELGFVFIAALILGAIYWKTKSLVLPIIIHGINNGQRNKIRPCKIKFGRVTNAIDKRGTKTIRVSKDG